MMEFSRYKTPSPGMNVNELIKGEEDAIEGPIKTSIYTGGGEFFLPSPTRDGRILS